MGMHEKLLYVSAYNLYIARQRIYEIMSFSHSAKDGYLSGKTVIESCEIYSRFRCVDTKT